MFFLTDYYYIFTFESVCQVFIFLKISVTTTCHLSFSHKWVNYGSKQPPKLSGLTQEFISFSECVYHMSWCVSEAGMAFAPQLLRYWGWQKCQHFTATLLSSSVTRGRGKQLENCAQVKRARISSFHNSLSRMALPTEFSTIMEMVCHLHCPI